MHLRVPLLLVLLFCLFTTCHAEGKSLAGVWKGSLGKMAVTACFNNGSPQANYYYQKYLVPIQLSADNTVAADSIPMRWREMSGNWHFNYVTNEEINGQWVSPDKSRTLPLHLVRITTYDTPMFDPAEYACGLDEFASALEYPRTPIPGPVREVNGFRYRELSLGLEMTGSNNRVVVGKDSDFRITTIEVLGNSPAINTLNQALRELVPLDEEAMSNMFVTRRENLAGGTDGEYGHEFQGIDVVGHWLCLRAHSWTTGGFVGQHIYEESYVFDLNTGKRVDLTEWLEMKDGWDSEEVPPVVYSKMDENDLNECGNSLKPTRISQKGIRFDLPARQDGSCGFGVEVSFKELGPYLSRKGKSAVAEISAAAMKK